MGEYILCAAIWYKDLAPKQKHQSCRTANNIDKGVVLCGWRHGNIIAQMFELNGLRTVTHAEDGVGDHEQGFLTSQNRFVDRNEAFKIAVNANQIMIEPPINLNQDLYSEDLY